MRLSFDLRTHTVLWKLCIPDPTLKSTDNCCANKGPSSQSYGFASSHVWMWELDYKSWVLKNWCFWTVVLEKTLESPVDSKEVQPVNLKGNQSWIFIGRTDAEAAILWPPDAKGWLIGKDPGAGKDWKQEKGMTEDEVAGWHRRLNGHEFEQTLGDSERQGSLACCSPWGHRVWHDWATELTEWLKVKCKVLLWREVPSDLSKNTDSLGILLCNFLCFPISVKIKNKTPTSPPHGPQWPTQSSPCLPLTSCHLFTVHTQPWRCYFLCVDCPPLSYTC